jgi:hypothetical protein
MLQVPRAGPGTAWYEARNLLNQAVRREIGVLDSMVKFSRAQSDADAQEVRTLTTQAQVFNSWLDAQAKHWDTAGTVPVSPWQNEPAARQVPVRIGAFGPLTYQNDNVLLRLLGRDRYSMIKLTNSAATPLLNVQDLSELYAYEIANFVDGKRNIGEIRDAVSAEYGPIPVAVVADYLKACAEAKIIEWK